MYRATGLRLINLRQFYSVPLHSVRMDNATSSRRGHRRSASALNSLLELELLLQMIAKSGNTLRDKNRLCPAPCRMRLEQSGHPFDVGFYFGDLLGFCQSNQTSKIFSIDMLLPGGCSFTQSGNNQILDDVVSIKVLFHGLALAGGKGEFSKQQVSQDFAVECLRILNCPICLHEKNARMLWAMRANTSWEA